MVERLARFHDAHNRGFGQGVAELEDVRLRLLAFLLRLAKLADCGGTQHNGMTMSVVLLVLDGLPSPKQ